MTADIDARREAGPAGRFLASTVFLPRSGDDAPPGILLSGSPGSPCVCVSSSLERLAEAVAARPGTPTTWLSMTGADFFAVLPAGCGVVVDALSASPVFLPHADLAAFAVAGSGAGNG